MCYEAKDSELRARQLTAQTIIFTGDLATATGSTNFPAHVVINNASLHVTTVTLDVGEPISKCFRVLVRDRVTGANIEYVSLPDRSVANKISITLDGTRNSDVVIEFVYSVDGHINPILANVSPLAVDLLSSGGYAVLAKTAITNTTGSLITGNMGVSPAFATSITNFGLVLDVSGDFATSASVDGFVYAADYSGTTEADLTQAVSDMEASYTEAAGRPNPLTTNYGGGIIGGLTFQPGVHKFTSNVTIPLDVTLNGSASDVIIFQIAGTLDLSASKKILLTGGLLAENVFFAVAGAVTLHATSTFEGNLLAQTSIAIQTNAIFHGRALAQSAVTLDDVTIN